MPSEDPKLPGEVLREFREHHNMTQMDFGVMMAWGGKVKPKTNAEFESNLERGRTRFKVTHLERIVKVCAKFEYDWIKKGDSRWDEFMAAIKYDGEQRRAKRLAAKAKGETPPPEDMEEETPEETIAEPPEEPIKSPLDETMKKWEEEINNPPAVDITQVEQKEPPKGGGEEVKAEEKVVEEPKKEPNSGKDQVEKPPRVETKSPAVSLIGLSGMVVLVIAVLVVIYESANPPSTPILPTPTRIPPEPTATLVDMPSWRLYKGDTYIAILTPMRWDRNTLKLAINVRNTETRLLPTAQPGVLEYGLPITYTSLRNEEGREYNWVRLFVRTELGYLQFNAYISDNVGPIAFEVPQDEKPQQLEFTIGWQETTGMKYMKWTIPSNW